MTRLLVVTMALVLYSCGSSVPAGPRADARAADGEAPDSTIKLDSSRKLDTRSVDAPVCTSGPFCGSTHDSQVADAYNPPIEDMYVPPQADSYLPKLDSKPAADALKPKPDSKPAADAFKPKPDSKPAADAFKPKPDTLPPSVCVIGGVTYQKGATKPGNVCYVCDPVMGPATNWSFNDGFACEDGNLCTHSDKCWNGTCVGVKYSCPTVGDNCNNPPQCTGKGVGPNPWDGICASTPKDVCKFSSTYNDCVPNGTINAAAPCWICDTSQSKTGWSYRNPAPNVGNGGTCINGAEKMSFSPETYKYYCTCACTATVPCKYGTCNVGSTGTGKTYCKL